ncbi:MAG TPA: EamA family transporter [Streptosporangiaceae bacterium]|jgi:drug/metabolite transporter (DMT)-like permease
MTLIMLSLGSAVVYGTADFFGGAASRRVPARSVLLISLPVGLLVLIAAALAVGQAPTAEGLAWGLAAGLAGGSGLIVFYNALARGPMSVVAPVAALISALLPVAVGLLQGDRLAPSVLIGVLVCLTAICLVSMDGTTVRPRSVRGPVLAVISGFGFGVFFILVREAGRHGSGALWALAASRTAGLLVVLTVVLVGWALLRRAARFGKARSFPIKKAGADNSDLESSIGETSSAEVSRAVLSETEVSATATIRVGERIKRPIGLGLAVDRATLVIAIGAGSLDSLANVLYLFATRTGMLSLAAVLVSLYPAITVLLARVVYSERLRTVQRLGVLLALAGVALVTAG